MPVSKHCLAPAVFVELFLLVIKCNKRSFAAKMASPHILSHENNSYFHFRAHFLGRRILLIEKGVYFMRLHMWLPSHRTV